MNRLSGYFFDGKSSQPKPGQLVANAEELRFEFADGSSTAFGRDQVNSCPNPASSILVIEFVSGEKFEAYSQEIDADIASLDRSSQRSWEKNWRACVAGLLVIFMFSAFFYWMIFPSLARKIAVSMPRSIENQVNSDFDQYITKISVDQKPELVSKLSSIADPIRSSYPELNLTIKLCCTKNFMANAFALPGGEIVATQQLVEELSPDELTAVLLHEVGHVHYHHAMQLLIENRFISSSVMLVAGYGNAYGWGGMLLSLANSREAEREADLFAGEALKKMGKAPSLLGAALDNIEKQPKTPLAHLGWFSTHPMTTERKKYLEAL